MAKRFTWILSREPAEKMLIEYEQARQRSQTPLDQWLEHDGDRKIQTGKRDERGTAQLHAEYIYFCRLHAVRNPVGLVTFSKQLSSRYEHKRDRSGRYFDTTRHNSTQL